jgi:hypothetical protein
MPVQCLRDRGKSKHDWRPFAKTGKYKGRVGNSFWHARSFRCLGTVRISAL